MTTRKKRIGKEKREQECYGGEIRMNMGRKHNKSKQKAQTKTHRKKWGGAEFIDADHKWRK